MSDYEKFKAECASEIADMAKDSELASSRATWLNQISRHKYTYHFEWLGRPIIQFPQDIVALQEIVFETKPDVIIETGIAHGGSLILSASLLEINAACGGNPNAKVIGIDIDLREENREFIERHPMAKRIQLIEGSSTADSVVESVRAQVAGSDTVLVLLDSNHTESHVYEELQRYANMVTPGSYCIVYDTVIQFLEEDLFPTRPWSVGNNPWTAVQRFLTEDQSFEVDYQFENKLQMTVAPGGYLKKVIG